MAFPKVKLSDNDGNTVGVDTSSNALNVKLVESIDSIDIGDVSLLLGGSPASVGADDVDAQTLRITLADDDILVNTLQSVIAVDGYTGPAKCLSMGGTTALGVLQELAVNASGHLTIENFDTAVTHLSEIEGAVETIESAIYADDGDFSLNSGKGIPMMAFQGTQSIDTGDVGVLRCSGGGSLRVMIAETSTTVPTSSEVVCGNATYSEDSTVCSVIGVVRNDSLDALANTNNEIAPLQVNADGALYVDGSDSTQPISGTVTANAGTNLNTSALSTHAKQDTMITHLSEIEGAVETIEGAITGSEMQVDVLSVVSSGTTIASYPQFDVDTSAFALNSASGINASVTTAKEIIIQCGFTNTGYIVVGDDALVAAEGVDSMDGIRLEAGDTLTLAATTTANIYLRGSANDQLVNVMIIS